MTVGEVRAWLKDVPDEQHFGLRLLDSPDGISVCIVGLWPARTTQVADAVIKHPPIMVLSVLGPGEGTEDEDDEEEDD